MLPRTLENLFNARSHFLSFRGPLLNSATFGSHSETTESELEEVERTVVYDFCRQEAMRLQYR